jgi:predicted unusual protein kinase regulating ubiquinone biosynthesis (AarF/ABC1/UbiB family)
MEPAAYAYPGAVADDLPTGRWRRAAKVGRLAGGQTARGYATKAANLTRSQEGRHDAAARRQMEAAEQIFEVLGQMKGAAMKVGQVASFMDTGAFPPEFQERIQAKLAELRDAAPRVPFKRMRKLIEDGLGERLDDVFAEFDEQAVAAASIGQVYRGRLHDGREVAVKVQYPGVAQAVRADLQNLGLIMRVAKRMAPGMDAKAMTREIRERLTDELDYEHEAQQHRAFARSWRGHPFIYVPPVVTELCSEHVLVSEWVEGTGFEEVKQADRATRDRIGEIVFRFYYGSMFRHGRFSGDPHPGNMILLPDGKVAFLDFGLFKSVDKEITERELACQRAVIEEDPVLLHKLLAELGFLPEPEKLDPQALYEYVVEGIWWYTRDESVRLNQKIVSTVAIETGDPRSKHFSTMRHQDIVPEHLFGRRLELLTLAVLGQLEAEANWYRIAREWIYDDEPQTELGKLETEYLRNR